MFKWNKHISYIERFPTVTWPPMHILWNNNPDPTLRYRAANDKSVFSYYDKGAPYGTVCKRSPPPPPGPYELKLTSACGLNNALTPQQCQSLSLDNRAGMNIPLAAVANASDPWDPGKFQWTDSTSPHGCYVWKYGPARDKWPYIGGKVKDTRKGPDKG